MLSEAHPINKADVTTRPVQNHLEAHVASLDGTGAFPRTSVLLNVSSSPSMPHALINPLLMYVPLQITAKSCPDCKSQRVKYPISGARVYRHAYQILKGGTLPRKCHPAVSFSPGVLAFRSIAERWVMGTETLIALRSTDQRGLVRGGSWGCRVPGCFVEQSERFSQWGTRSVSVFALAPRGESTVWHG